MRILHISTTDNEGAGLCCLRIHDALLKSGVESKVIVWHNTKCEKEEYQYGYWRYRINKIPSRILRALGLSLTRYNKIRKLSREKNTIYSLPTSPVKLHENKWIEWADIIHLHWVNNYVDLPSFFKKVRKPIVWTLHDENLFYGIAHHHKNILPNNPLEIKYRKVKFDAVQSAENLTIVFLSQMMYQNFGNEKIIEGRKKTVISNSVNTHVFKPQPKLEMRQKYGIDANIKVFVLTSLNIADPNKGLDVLSKVLSEIDPNARILAIGGNPWNKTWKNVHSVGLIKSQQEMCELISCADYMAMPSYQEAFPQSPMEAMACGLPVVAFPVSGTSELINDKNGVICDDFTSDALKKGIETLLKREYSAEEIRQDMIDSFSPDSIADKYIQLYKKILV